MDNLYMRDLISEKNKHLLYRDESPELCDFLILNYAEIYRVSKTELRLIIWSPRKSSQLQKMGVISNVHKTDDTLVWGNVDNSNLDALIELGTSLRRIHINGKKIKKLENLLGHKILPYNPVKLSKKLDF